MERIGRKKSRIEEKVTAPLNKHLLIQTQCCSAAIMFMIHDFLDQIYSSN